MRCECGNPFATHVLMNDGTYCVKCAIIRGWKGARMEPKETIYLSGPMTGIPEFNAPAFAAYALKYREQGFHVLSPPELDAAGKKDDSYANYLRRDMRLFLDNEVDRVYMLPGWANSRGAKLEKHVAEMLEIPIYDAETGEPLIERGVLKDSGDRRHFSTGAVRDAAGGKGRFDLVPYYAELAIARQMERGADKYDARNWEKGIPLSVFANSAKRHLGKLVAGYEDEPHLDAALWNLACFAETQERIRRGILPAELDDMPHTYREQDPDAKGAQP